ncbi:hypothetical protein CEG18_29235 [Pseudomonas nitroreducens]|uniref:Uncharacterized protein n=1 Tax=Pseudomonas nitroreducens TaxID=46680 RepID=A0A246F2W5_PSENT|nr:hypothetical protein CEG18_29235 [Pseudomonas nitroreducens]
MHFTFNIGSLGRLKLGLSLISAPQARAQSGNGEAMDGADAHVELRPPSDLPHETTQLQTSIVHQQVHRLAAHFRHTHRDGPI